MLFYPKEEWQDVVLILLEGETMEPVLGDVVMFELLQQMLISKILLLGKMSMHEQM